MLSKTNNEELELSKMSDEELERHFATVPKAIQDGKLIIRDSAQWNFREAARRTMGCVCMGFGTIETSLATNGRSAQIQPE